MLISRKTWDPYYHARVRFEECYGGGQHFHYGAVNIGGLGAPRYGQFYAVFGKVANGDHERCAVLGEDSLTGPSLRDAAGKLLEQLMVPHLAAPAQVGQLLALKHAEGLHGSDGTTWPDAVCGDDVYAEVISIDAPVRDAMAEVRVDSRVREEFEQRALGLLASGGGLTDGLDIARYNKLESMIEDQGTLLVEVTP